MACRRVRFNDSFGQKKATSLELLSYQMDINVNARFTCFALRIKIEDEDDRQSNDLGTVFGVTLHGALPNGTVTLYQAAFFDVRPIRKPVLEPGKELLDLLAPYLGRTLVHAVMYAVFSECVGDNSRVPARWHACVERINVVRHKSVGVLSRRR